MNESTWASVLKLLPKYHVSETNMAVILNVSFSHICVGTREFKY